MIIEVGKTYNLRNGDTARILYISHNLAPSPVVALQQRPDGSEDVVSYSIDGVFAIDRTESGLDIVSEHKGHYPLSDVALIDMINTTLTVDLQRRLIEQARRGNLLARVMRDSLDVGRGLDAEDKDALDHYWGIK